MASLVKSLTEEDFKYLYHCDKNQRKVLLANILCLPQFSKEEDDMKWSILFDFYWESVNFASEHGFSWRQGIAVIEVMKKLLCNTLGKRFLHCLLNMSVWLFLYAHCLTDLFTKKFPAGF